ncbi:MAG: hypothetical protein QM765_15810 [Myxococcales bacterium]
MTEARFEAPDGARVVPVGTYLPPPEVRLVLMMERRWLPSCSRCGARCRKKHCDDTARRWSDLPWGEHPVSLEYLPIRVKCERCEATPLEAVPCTEPRGKARLGRRGRVLRGPGRERPGGGVTPDLMVGRGDMTRLAPLALLFAALFFAACGQPQHAKKARSRYCRCEEPVKYVSSIQTRYDKYSRLAKLE